MVALDDRIIPMYRGPIRAAFTVVEFVVTVMVGALLFAAFAPALETARQRSRQAVCLDRLATIATASQTYAAGDPAGFAIPVHQLMFQQDPLDPTYIGAYEWGGKSGIGEPGFTDGPSEGSDAWISSKYGTKAGFGPPTRPLNSILYPHGFRDNLSAGFQSEGAFLDTRLELPVYRCPADEGPPPARPGRAGPHCPDWVRNPDRSSYDHFGNSYVANKFMTSYVGGGPVWSNSPYLRPLSRIPNPVRMLQYEENIGRWAWQCKREKRDCLDVLGEDGIDPGPTKALRGWHGKDWMFNRVFVDGHAEMQKILLEGTEDSNGYFEHYWTELVFPDDPAKQEQSVCIIVRGPGWQKDTLPAPPIPTGLEFDGSGRASFDGCVNY